ncbi:MAG: type-F conjugative transfer system secretin TraK [Thermodesulfovibrio sp.]|nr:type-F conjugative transfer system secretin TraK [Thermodesulfovibrio sp.]
MVSVLKVLFINILAILILSVSLLSAKEGDLWQTVGNVSVRQEPNSNSSIISYLKQGTIVEEIEQQGNWIKVKTQKNGVIGWVYKPMLTPATKDALKQCEGIQGFTAVCPVQKDIKVPQDKPIGKVSSEVPPGLKAQNIKDQNVSVQNVPVFSGVQMPSLKLQEQEQVINRKETDTKIISAEKLLTDADLSLGVRENGLVSQDSFLSGSSYIVGPERLAIVKMSSSDINRIVCPVDIKDVVYSEEKGIQVKISGKNAFVKFLVKRIGGKETYSKIPVDIYVVCGDKVYSLLAMPERTPPATVYLEDKEQKIKEIVEKNLTIPYERRIVNYVKELMSGRPLPEATYSRVEKEYKFYQEIELKEKGQYVIEGEGLMIRVFYITGKKQGVEIREKDFLRKEITDNPLAISIDKLKLNPGEKAILLILERVRG